MLQHLARTGVKLLPGPVPLQISGQQVRFKKFGKWIVPHRKPRWIPMARSKMFVDPPESTVPISEQEHIKELETEYLMRMKALQWYLHEDDLKAGDTGEAALIAAQKEEKIHLQNIQENEEENRRIAAARQERLAREAEERKERIAQELREFDVKEAERLEEMEALVEREAEQIDNRIKQEDLEKAIETALANPIDLEYAIDFQGNIFRGRSTKSKKVKPENYEKLPLASEN